MFNLFSKKTALLASLFILTSILLVGCGSKTNSPEATAEAVISAVPTATTAASIAVEPTTRIFTDALGRKVELPANPQRIIAHYYAAEMVALGIPITGTNYVNAEEVLTKDQLQGVEDIGGDTLAPNLEKLLTLAPDLIIVPDFLETNNLEALSKIAPTVVISYGSDVFSRLRTLGEIVGKPDNAEAWIKSYTVRTAEKRSLVKPFIKEGETASAFVLYLEKKLYIYGPQRLGPTMYDALGFKVPAKAAELFQNDKETLWKEISLETLPDYVGDRVFLVTQKDEAAKKEIEEIINGPIWKTLPAVKNKHAYVVGNRWGLNDPLSLEWVLDEMTKLIVNE